MKPINADKLKRFLERCIKDCANPHSEYKEGMLDAYISVLNYVDENGDTAAKCPCCNEGTVITITSTLCGETMWHRAFCTECFRTGPFCDTKKEAVEAFYERWSK